MTDATSSKSRSSLPPRAAASHPRWLLIALTCIGVHQLQSLLDAPEERAFRTVNMGLITWLAAGSPLLPRASRGAVWTILSLPPLFGAVFGHLLPIARGEPVPPSSETAPLNAAGAALLLVLGVALLRDP